MNAASVRAWFRDEADRDASRNPQPEVLKMNLSTSHEDKFWPEAVLRSDWDCYEMKLPDPKKRKDFWAPPGEQTIALIAHDAMKDRMVDFAVQYENELSKFKRILATGTTGKDVEDACRKLRDEKKICKCLSGPKGGDIEIATEIVYGRCHVVVFFVDPMHPHAHIDDIRVVFSACMAEIDNNDVRMLTNEVQAREWMEEAVRRRPS